MSLFQIIIWSAVIVLIAAVVQSAVGFGFSLISVPLLSLFLPLNIIVPLVVIDSLMINLLVLSTARKHVTMSKIGYMVLFGIIGIPIGVYGLQTMPDEVLKVIVGVLICITSIVMAKGYKLNFKSQKLGCSLAGFLSGVLNGSLSMSGPPIVLFMSNEGFGKDEFRASLAAYAAITNVITIVVFIFNGALHKEMLTILSTNVIFLILGGLGGVLLAKKIKDKHFDSIVLILLGIVGAVTVVKVLI